MVNPFKKKARPDLHEHVLRLQRTQHLERGASHVVGAILHSDLRHSSRRDSRGARRKTLGPGHGLQAHRFLNRIGFEDGHQLEVAVDVDALARERSGNGGGNDEHIFVEAKGYVGHGASFLVFPIIAYARGRASLETPRLTSRIAWSTGGWSDPENKHARIATPEARHDRLQRYPQHIIIDKCNYSHPGVSGALFGVSGNVIALHRPYRAVPPRSASFSGIPSYNDLSS